MNNIDLSNIPVDAEIKALALYEFLLKKCSSACSDERFFDYSWLMNMSPCRNTSDLTQACEILQAKGYVMFYRDCSPIKIELRVLRPLSDYSLKAGRKPKSKTTSKSTKAAGKGSAKSNQNSQHFTAQGNSNIFGNFNNMQYQSNLYGNVSSWSNDSGMIGNSSAMQHQTYQNGGPSLFNNSIISLSGL